MFRLKIEKCQLIKQLLFAATVFSIFAGCNSSSSAKSGDGNSAGDTVYAVEGFGGLSASLAMDNGSPAISAEVEVQSHPEYNTTADSKGNLSIKNMVPGEYTVFVSGALAGLVRSPRAAKFKNIVVGASATTTLPDIALTPPGAIMGTVEILNNPENVTLNGIIVYIPGTSFTATTDANGDFLLANIPAGDEYTVEFSKSGLSVSFISDITVASGDTTDLGDVGMALSTGPSGSFTTMSDSTIVTINSVATTVVTSTSDVVISFKYDSRAVLMKLAHESAFINRDWVPVRGSYTFSSVNAAEAKIDFSEDGQKNIYLKFADLNGLESSVYWKEFIIDTEAPEMESVRVLNGWATTASPSVYIDINATDRGTGIKEIMFDNINESFTTGAWQSFEYRNEWMLTADIGAKIVYTKVRDYLNQTSTFFASTSSDAINLSTFTEVYPATYTEALTFDAERSPFYLDGSYIFEGNVHFGAGADVLFRGNGADSSFKFNGTVTSAGSAGSEVYLRGDDSTFMCSTPDDNNGGPATLQFNTGTPGISHQITHTVFDSIKVYINGGNISHSKFTSESCGGSDYVGSIKKTGYDNLIVINSLFDKWYQGLNAYGGDGNIIFTDNSGTVQYLFDSYHMTEAHAYGINTIFSHNNFTVSGVFTRINYTTGDFFSPSSTNNNIILKSGASGFNVSNNSVVTLYGITLTPEIFGGCNELISLGQSSSLTLTNSAVTCDIILKTGSDVTLNFESSTINVSNNLFYTQTWASTASMSITDSTIVCDTSLGDTDVNRPFCDLMFMETHPTGTYSS